MRLSLNYVVKIFVLLLLSVFSFASAQSAGSDSLNDPIYAFMGNGGYDVLDYQIDLRFSSDKKTVVGITTMDWLEHIASNSGQAVRDWQERWLFDDLPPEFPELGLKPTDFPLGADFK
jgi:hypothetical protein